MSLACPSNYPVKCDDGSCQTSVAQCPPVAKTPAGMIKCPEGQFASSLSLCPSVSDCGGELVKCWDGSCASVVEKDQDPCPFFKPYLVCSNELPRRCPDGSCSA